MNKKKSILISTWTYPPFENGVSHVAEAHVMGLMHLGHDVTVVTSYNSLRSKTDFNYEVVQFNIGGGARLGQEKYFGEINEYKNYITNYKGDVILFHCWASWNTELAIKVFPKTKAKKILVSHGVSFNLGSILSRCAWRPYMWTLIKKAKTFDRIVFLSNRSDCDRFYDKYLLEKKGFTKWTVIPNGTYPEIFACNTLDFRKTLNIEEDKRIILCLAAYSPAKNQEMALHAFMKANCDNSVLVFIGNKFNDYVLKLKQIVSTEIIDKSRVLFLENINKSLIISAYNAANIFLCPSKTEVFPLVILDAMASGTPFISNDIGCVTELPGGEIVNSEDEMAFQIQELINNSDQYNKLKYSGIKACYNVYNWHQISKDYDHLINWLIN